MQEPAELGPSAAVILAAALFSPALALLNFAGWGWKRYRLDRNGGFLAVIRFTVGGTAHDSGLSEEEKATIFFTLAKWFDFLWIIEVFPVVASIVLLAYGFWDFALVLGIHQGLPQVSFGTQRVRSIL
jgi:hypothetical protein